MVRGPGFESRLRLDFSPLIALILTKTVDRVFCRADFVAWNPEKQNEAFYENISRQRLINV